MKIKQSILLGSLLILIMLLVGINNTSFALPNADTICDDGAACFSYNGFWNPPGNPNQYCEYGGDMRYGYSCYINNDCRPDNDNYSVFWKPAIGVGIYDISAYISRVDSATPHTQSAKYYLRCPGDSAATAPLIATINQAHPYQDNNSCAAGNRWASLGRHYLGAGCYIELRAWTNESASNWGSKHHLIFADAIRFSPLLPPVADAGVPQSVNSGVVVILDGSGSNDPDGTNLSYSWVQNGGPTVILNNNTSASPTFIAPATSEVLTFILTVTDIHGLSDNDNVTVTVTNQPPIADAGTSQSTPPDVIVALDGSGSHDPEGGGLAYNWIQDGGMTVMISNNTAVSPTFTTPMTSGILTFTLTVTDSGGLSNSDNVTVTVTNQPPIADAGISQFTNPNLTVILDGSGSHDPEGYSLTYNWVQTSGMMVTLNSSTAISPTFTAPTTLGTLTFTLTVTDAGGLIDSDVITVMVEPHYIYLPVILKN